MSSRKRKWSAAGTSSQKIRDAAEASFASNQLWEKDLLSQDSWVFSKSHQDNVRRRHKVEEALNMFRELSSKLLREYEAEVQGHMNARRKAWIEVAMFLHRRHKWVNTRKQLGPVPGIEVGDQCQCMAELNVIGLHRQFFKGIDCMKKDGILLATSIVVSDRYANDIKSSNSLTYIGQGGNPRVRNLKPTDQKLNSGNLAMKNSMEAKTPVRVIFKVFRKSDGTGTGAGTLSRNSSNFTYLYDGLYLVEKMIQLRGEFGKLVFSFSLTRISDQSSSFSLNKINKSKSCIGERDVVCMNRNLRKPPSFVPKDIKKSKTSITQREVVCVNDISQGQEKFPIRVVTSVGDALELTPIDYIVNIVYPKSYMQPLPHGCGCIDGCMDHEKCACAIKNGGSVPYDCSGKLTAQTKSVIYECGPSCKCSSSCFNRVTQFGIQFQLEIFRTDLKGWGVRTRSFIPSGRFVCEYVGEVYLDKEAELRLDVDKCVFKIGVGKGFIDATQRGNIGRFINHSCSPNLCVKDVMYDHGDKRLPHKMLFALKNIPAGRELSYNYNGMKGKSNEGVSKIGSKSCHCGSVQCIGRIYI